MRWRLGAGLMAALIIAGLVSYIHHLHNAQSAARDAQFKAAVDAIHRQRTSEDQAAVADKRERDALKAEVARNRETLRQLAARSTANAAETARDEAAARDLEAHPTCENLSAAAKRLRVESFRCVAKPVTR